MRYHHHCCPPRRHRQNTIATPVATEIPPAADITISVITDPDPSIIPTNPPMNITPGGRTNQRTKGALDCLSLASASSMPESTTRPLS
mmetsp:Transcript_4674/g.8122  ORF Transcript_4674/g.8122 Transcript_4674/m.8122 type:complete len:88 (-) Transcript_4674:3407-3670(-)